MMLLVAFGALVLLTAWLPMILKEAPLSLPIVCVAIGAMAGASSISTVPHPASNLPAVEKMTELVVIISLMGAALKIDRKIGWRSWATTWRLLAIAMPLTIGALALAGYALLGLSMASALLLAAALAPTDPVLASDVQVGPPKSGEEDDTRFALTSEAGLNDGLAFPFVMCAIAMANAPDSPVSWLGRWLYIDVVWRLGVGVAVGAVLGYGLGWLVFRIPNRAKLSRTGDGFVALGITVLVFGLSESVHGYGFVSVFVSGLALRAAERDDEYHQTLHDFAEQLERLLMMILLVLFGGALASSQLLGALSWDAAVYAIVAIFVVRPLTAWISLSGTTCPLVERGVVSFFGIRGVGSVYYLAYALQKGSFGGAEIMWSATAFIILASILLHGVTVTPMMRLIDRRRDQGATAREERAIAEGP